MDWMISPAVLALKRSQTPCDSNVVVLVPIGCVFDSSGGVPGVLVHTEEKALHLGLPGGIIGAIELHRPGGLAGVIKGHRNVDCEGL